MDYAAAPQSAQLAQRSFLRQVFSWMFLAVALTTGVAAYMSATAPVSDYFDAHPNAVWGLFAAQIGLVIVLSWAMSRLNATVAMCLFAVYAGSVGITFAVLAEVYTTASIIGAFAGASGVFAGMAAYGYTTDRDLTGLGGILFGCLIGFFFASIAYAFVGGDTLNLILGWVGVLLFSALTAYDMQKLKQAAAQAATLSHEDQQRLAILGALGLYLDFVNLVIALLRIFGVRR
jgi:FtsH-binding integral membrane protein